MKAPEIVLQAQLIEFEQRLGGKDRELVYRARKTIGRYFLGTIHARDILKGLVEEERNTPHL